MTAPPTSAPPTSGPRVQRITVTPATGITSGQQIRVDASGFCPDEALVVTECAAKGARTGAGDCNLAGMLPTNSDGSGNVEINFTVTKGPFGANQIVCGPQQACLISVTQATLSPTEEADTPVSFRYATPMARATATRCCSQSDSSDVGAKVQAPCDHSVSGTDPCHRR